MRGGGEEAHEEARVLGGQELAGVWGQAGPEGHVLQARGFGLVLGAVTRGLGPGDSGVTSMSQKGLLPCRAEYEGTGGGWETRHGPSSEATVSRREGNREGDLKGPG